MLVFAMLCYAMLLLFAPLLRTSREVIQYVSTQPPFSGCVVLTHNLLDIILYFYLPP